MLHSLLSRLVVAAALLAALPASTWSQPLPLAPAKVVVDRVTGLAGDGLWQVGPILLNLPTTWGNPSMRGGVARLYGPNNTAASFTVLSATEAARAAGYSAISDTQRGPDSFSRHLLWDDCEGTPERAAHSLSAPAGSYAMYAECTVEAKPGVHAAFTQVALYSRHHLVQIQVLGSREETAIFLKSLQSVRWLNET